MKALCEETMDAISIKNMGFFAYHGTTKEERSIGQRFYIDIEMQLNLERAGKADSIEHTVNYQQVYHLIGKITQNKKYKIIEALAEDIADAIMLQFPMIKKTIVWVRKPQVPLSGILDCVEVRLERENQNNKQ